MFRCCEQPQMGPPPGALATALALLLATTGATAATLAAPADVAKSRYGFGTPATPAQIAAWDIDVRPDGAGLPPGRGTVAQGQQLYDAQCASCHGTFGESNQYMQIAGGVGTLRTDQPMRTTGSKLKHATTLFDYIRRAMPFTAPKSLTDDEVYALTAYVLHLNDVLPADGALDRTSLVALKLPNRDGFTTAHGMMRRDGRPDTRNEACMRDCGGPMKLSSQFPVYALDAHGELAEQTRALGPVEGAAHGSGRAGSGPARKPDGPLEVAKRSACMACHGVTEKIVGPAFREVAARYAGMADAEARLTAKVRDGGTGSWGSIPMPPQSQLGEAELRGVIGWILGGAR
jgi:S-disulfanyl-L-cysteine oxidoreductase SoxD